jgi:hypothetical protein
MMAIGLAGFGLIAYRQRKRIPAAAPSQSRPRDLVEPPSLKQHWYIC